MLAELLAKDISAYVPLSKVLKQWSDRKKWIYEPLINGYVFVNIEDSFRDKILHTPNVVGFVRHGNKDSIIRQEEIDVLKEIEQHGYEISLYQQPITTGKQYTVSQGSLKGCLVQVLEIENEYAACVFVMESINQNFKVKLPTSILKIEPIKK